MSSGFSGFSLKAGRAKAEEEAKAREDKNATNKAMARALEEHGDKGSILGAEQEDDPSVSEYNVPTGSKRHFTGRPKSMKSGPGTLNSGPTSNFSRPSGAGGFSQYPSAKFGILGPEASPANFMKERPDEEEGSGNLVAKASNLPPSMEPDDVEALFDDYIALNITNIEELDSPSHGRPSASMKITFEKNTASSQEFNHALTQLNDKKYLGRGYYLHLDRYYSDGAVATEEPLPFGARLVVPESQEGFAPSSELQGFVPSSEIQGSAPSSELTAFAPSPELKGEVRNEEDEYEDEEEDEDEDDNCVFVPVSRPPDMEMLRLIHQTIEMVVQGGLEFEAALMEVPEVQGQERFAWLYDQTHPLNRYYRWRLYKLLCPNGEGEIFEDYGLWEGPDPLPYEFAYQLASLQGPPNVGSAEATDDDEQAPKQPPVGDDYPGRPVTGYGMLAPDQRAYLVHCLQVLPIGPATSQDIADISLFAAEHSTDGLDEIIDVIVSNLFDPLRSEEDLEELVLSSKDAQSLTLNALLVIHDVASSTSQGEGMAWKFRTLIGEQLLQRGAFKYLESLPQRLEMGKVQKNGFRKEVNAVLSHWRDVRLFDENLLDEFDAIFNAREEEEDKEKRLALAQRLQLQRKKKKLAERENADEGEVHEGEDDDMDIDDDDDDVDDDDDEEGEEEVETGDPEEEMELDGEEDAETEAGHANEDVHIDPAAKAIVQDRMSSRAGEAIGVWSAHSSAQESSAQESSTAPALGAPGETAAARARRARPKAEDMFAYSDGE